MKTGMEMKPKEIIIKKFSDGGEIDYEIRIIDGDSCSLLWLDPNGITMLRNRITEALKEEVELSDEKFDLLREKQDFIDSMENAGGFDKNCPDISYDKEEDDGEY